MKSFTELSLTPALLKSIQELGYETPSPIQAEALPILLGEPTDFMGLAATGTGKTAAFAIPLIDKIDASLRDVQALILCPTRELALQVCGQINLLGKYSDIRALPIYGGSSYAEQLRGLRDGIPVVVGTPGRLVDHITSGKLNLKNVKTVILDEADEMISMGFKEDLETILGAIPKGDAKTWLFSATMSADVRGVADKFLNKPQKVHINRTEMVPTTVQQLYYMTQEGNKPEVLCKLIDAADGFYGLIFCQTKALVSDLSQYLSERGYKVDSLHGDKDQKGRERTMQAFRDKKVQMLICTDVASRGLDVKDITHVINYSLPRELDNYVHRIGRTARSGKTGIAMSLVTPSHRRLVFQIERMTKSRMEEGRIPTRKDIGAKKVEKIMARFNETDAVGTERAISLLSPELKEALALLTPEQITGRFLALTFPEIFAETAEVQMQKPQQRTDRPERSDRGGSANFARRDHNGRGDRQDRGPRPFARRSDSAPREDRGGERPPRAADRGDRADHPGIKRFEPRRTFNSDESETSGAPYRPRAASAPRSGLSEGGERPPRRTEGAPRSSGEGLSPRWAGRPPRIKDFAKKRFAGKGGSSSRPPMSRD